MVRKSRIISAISFRVRCIALLYLVGLSKHLKIVRCFRIIGVFVRMHLPRLHVVCLLDIGSRSIRSNSKHIVIQIVLHHLSPT